MEKSKLFQYAIIWHPTEKQVKDNGLKSVILVQPNIILAKDANAAQLSVAMEIPLDKKAELDQIEIVMRPF